MKKTFLILLVLGLCINTIAQEEIRLKQNNPDLAVNLGVGLWGMPIPVDYDGDGLMDILMTCPDTPYRGIYFFKNIGTSENPFRVSKLHKRTV